MPSDAADPFDTRNAGKPWSDNDVMRLRNLAMGSQVMRLIVRELGRPEAELEAKVRELGITIGTRHFDRLGHLDPKQTPS